MTDFNDRRKAGSLLLGLFSLPVAAADWVYTVAEGDNLWDLSEKYLDSELRDEQVRRLNNLPRRGPGTALDSLGRRRPVPPGDCSRPGVRITFAQAIGSEFDALQRR